MLVVVDFFILLLLSVLLAFVDTGAALESSREFKVMTLNAFNFVDGPNWEKRVYEIREMVLRHDPDCVAFEEVSKNSSASMLVNTCTPIHSLTHSQTNKQLNAYCY